MTDAYGKSRKVWPARRRGDLVECGFTISGRHDCTGALAVVEHRKTRDDIPQPLGLVEEPPGSGYWRLTKRSQRRGKPSTAHRAYTLDGVLHDPKGLLGDAIADGAPVSVVYDGRQRTRYPWYRDCPVCGRLAEVTLSLLSS